MTEDEFRYKETYRHPAQGIEFDNLHPIDSLCADIALYKQALQEATDALEWYVNQDNGSHAVTRLNKIADIMGWERRR